jgi:hypothetical protein
LLPSWPKRTKASAALDFSYEPKPADLMRDIDAIRNVIIEPWSNGPVEAHINKLKTLKLAIYGRCGTQLLRARMVPF